MYVNPIEQALTNCSVLFSTMFANFSEKTHTHTQSPLNLFSCFLIDTFRYTIHFDYTEN